MLRALISYQCGPGSICVLSLLLVLAQCSGFFFWVLPFSSLQIQVWRTKDYMKSSEVGSSPDITKFF